MEIIKVKDGIYYIEDSTNIGLIEVKEGFIIVDSGIDKDKGKKIKKILEESGLKPKYLILTHHHADHTGGAKFLKDYFKLKILADAKEKVFIENPILEPIYLSLGSSPNKYFLTKWIKSEEVSVDITIESFDTMLFGNIKPLNLQGHSIGMVGLMCENVIFSSDAFFSKEVLDKYVVPYFHDFEKFISSMENLLNINYEYIIPSHGKLYKKAEGDEVIRYNLNKVKEIEDKVYNTLNTPKTIQEIFLSLELKPHDPVVHTLVESSIRSILNYFVNKDLIEVYTESGKQLYKRK